MNASETGGVEKIKVDWLEKAKLVFVCLLIFTATIAFAFSLRILFILSPHLAVILGLFTFIGINLWNWYMQSEVDPKTILLKIKSTPKK